MIPILLEKNVNLTNQSIIKLYLVSKNYNSIVHNSCNPDIQLLYV